MFKNIGAFLLITMFSVAGVADDVTSITLDPASCNAGNGVFLSSTVTGNFSGDETQIWRIVGGADLCVKSINDPNFCFTVSTGCPEISETVEVEYVIDDPVFGELGSAQSILTARNYASSIDETPSDVLAGYKGKAVKLAKNFIVTIDDTLLSGIEGVVDDNPEDYKLIKVDGLMTTSTFSTVNFPANDVQFKGRYARFLVSKAPKDDTFPKTTKHIGRTWEVDNKLGTLTFMTIKTKHLLLPVTVSGEPDLTLGMPAYVCYQGKVVNGAQAPGGKFDKNTQFLYKDEYGDCTGNFPGSYAADKCLVDLKKFAEICSPATINPPDPGRETSATITGKGIPSLGADGLAFKTLACYQAKGNKKVKFKDEQAAFDAGLPGAPIALGTETASAHTSQTETLVPSAGFPEPMSYTTKKLDSMCIPSAVTSVNFTP